MSPHRYMANNKLTILNALARMLLCARFWGPVLLSQGLVLVPTSAAAQSAADKATARKLATAGIKLFQQSKFDDALDKLKRAQALYDAPVHLLYMARCQVQLGQLVEGAESYRKLVRTELDAKSPDVFKKAVEDGEKELAEVEPRIPSLTINVEPSSVQGLQIKLDAEPVSLAVLGVDMPVNPGERVIVAEAPGYLSAESSITVAEGATQQISLSLQVDPNAPEEPQESAPPPLPGAATPPGVAPQADPEAWRTKEIPLSAVSFLVGLRGGVLVPSGELQRDTSTSDYMGVGGGGELSGGVRFLRNFGVKLFFEWYNLLPGSQLDRASPVGLSDDTDQFEVTSKVTASSFGISGIAGTQRGRFGGYGELGVALVHNYGWSRDIIDTNASRLPDFLPCTESQTFTGPALRVGGAVVFPVHENLQLSAQAMATLGNFSKHRIESNCSITRDGLAPLEPFELETDIPSNDRQLHRQFFIGVGGDFVFGPG